MNLTQKKKKGFRARYRARNPSLEEKQREPNTALTVGARIVGKVIKRTVVRHNWTATEHVVWASKRKRREAWLPKLKAEIVRSRSSKLLDVDPNHPWPNPKPKQQKDNKP